MDASRELSPAVGPSTAAIVGAVPESRATSMKWCIGARPSPIYSSVRAPAPSNSQTSATRSRRASSIIRCFFAKFTRPSEPPSTVKSSATTPAMRPSIRPKPVTTPSAGVTLSFTGVTRVGACVASPPISVKLPRVHEHGDPLARRLLAGPALAGDLRLAAMPFGRGPAAREFVERPLCEIPGQSRCPFFVMPGLVPGIFRHRFPRTAAWMPGTSPRLSGLDLADRAHGLDSSRFRRARPNRDPDRRPARRPSPSSCPDLFHGCPV